MTRLENGPGGGVVLSLRSAPLLLRVTYNRAAINSRLPRARVHFWDAFCLSNTAAKDEKPARFP